MSKTTTNVTCDVTTLFFATRSLDLLKLTYKHFSRLLFAYKYNRGDTGWPVIHGRVFLVSDLSSVHMYSTLNWTSHFLQVTKKHGHVYLVSLYILQRNIFPHPLFPGKVTLPPLGGAASTYAGTQSKSQVPPPSKKSTGKKLLCFHFLS